ncbi:sugar phosphate isomerase/epimerase [Mucilaginibacter limnophilus]|uniref:Sugar phosphate isomerase/epimerase n=1 Tax=Mucilaginibacter limnophilus TaxID=1932778 RepID=A0A437MSX2_9SPHI|nr:sugar phosphate isomerase/epimerase family protein [Mucilaginibacter limnophilus]RVU00740.1 sugar phosphate isomerase/epimerase [Mucilaginibacter limnophilus]
MQNTRRSFLKSSAMLAAAAVASPRFTFAADNKLRRTAVQLYSVRDEMNKDPKGTLKKLADLGYTHIEHANYNAGERKFYGYPVKEFKTLLSDLGLKMPSGHTTMGRNHWDTATNDFTDEWKRTVEDAAEIGQRYVISPSLGWGAKMTEDFMKPFMEQFNKCGEFCQKSSMKFAYHNHDFEFRDKVGDVLVFDYMLQNTDPKLVTWQLDIGNMYIAGGMAADYINKYPGRFESMHVKDMKAVEGGDAHHKYESCVLGKGIVPVKDILKLGRKKGGTVLFVIEQEEYQGLGQSESVGIDLQIMKKWGY